MRTIIGQRGRMALTWLLLIFLITLIVRPAQAADGDLDPTFGAGGTVTTDFSSSSSDWAFALILQPDGKLVAAGRSSYNFALTRYNANGTLDTSFGSGGKVTTDFGFKDTAFALILQPDGKLVAAGTSAQFGGNSNTDRFALARYNADGSLDPSFGGGGTVTTGFEGTTLDDAFALILQPDGKLVAAGSSGLTFALARYNADGSLDPGFGSGGKVLTDVGWPNGAFALILQPDGRLVAAGIGSTGGTALVRYTANGTLDPSFGSGGTVTTDVPAYGARALILQPDGKLVAAGSLDNNFALARYNAADGSLDTSFGGGGTVMTDFGDADGAFALVLQPDGKLVAAGHTNAGGAWHFALARYNANGTLDPSFGSGGTVATVFDPSYWGEPQALVLQPDGKLVAAGYWITGRGGYDFALARYIGGGGLTTLTVTKAGTGSGTVTSSPAGINCGSTCSGSFASGTAVTLTATADAGSTFAGWSGDCNGSGQVTMNANKSCTATFTRITT
ncbi:MAG: hypothetical protein KGJ40_07160, partial [candidate division NC10 bacterium]|nr:hypothetical protein [candidate division NC10 bacterium]